MTRLRRRFLWRCRSCCKTAQLTPIAVKAAKRAEQLTTNARHACAWQHLRSTSANNFVPRCHTTWRVRGGSRTRGQVPLRLSEGIKLTRRDCQWSTRRREMHYLPVRQSTSSLSCSRNHGNSSFTKPNVLESPALPSHHRGQYSRKNIVMLVRPLPT